MSTYVIGDLQGCYEPLMRLLEHIHYDQAKDTLWFTGDLANRGPHPLETLRFLYSIKDQTRIVLGNHDLTLFAWMHQIRMPGPHDTASAVLTAPDAFELIHWLRTLPLMLCEQDYVLVHAGIYPSWTLEEAIRYALEFETHLQSKNYVEYLARIFPQKAATWPLTDVFERGCFFANAFTRMRFCAPDGRLDLLQKGAAAPPPLLPWYQLPNRPCATTPILFGHWSSLRGVTQHPYAIALDTGCIWGHLLTAFRLEDQQRFTVAG